MLRLVFFGGDVFALPRSFEDLLSEAAEEARAQGVTLICDALSDGTSWTLDQVRRLAALGLSDYHVALDGPRPVQDAARPARKGGSFDRILNSLRWHRDGARVEIRVDAALPDAATDELWTALERDGLLEGPNPVTLTFGPRRTCRQHAARLAAVKPPSDD